jgi:hypothetical protein
MTSQYSEFTPNGLKFHQARNANTRIDVFEELSTITEAALRQFFRGLDVPQYMDEVLIPRLKLGDAQIYATVRDRPWPPWGLGARTFSAVCEIHSVAPESWAVSPVHLAKEDLTNVGLASALYKEVLETLAISQTAEVCYLAAEGSVLADHVLCANGFSRDEDVFLTEQARYFTYRANVRELLKQLCLDDVPVPDLLAHDFEEKTLARNALFHQSILLAGRPDLRFDRVTPEIIELARGGHAAKPAGVPGGTGTALGTDQFGDLRGDLPYVSLANFLGDDLGELMKQVLDRKNKFQPATVLPEDGDTPVIDERMRRAATLDDVAFIESNFVDRLKGALPGALSRMGIKGFPVGRIELQVTASADSDYYRMHRDADARSTRVLSFVYFFHAEPRQFYGGELRLYDNRRVGGIAHADWSQLLSPRQGMLVIFPSSAPHELLPVRVPSKKFSDSRFTLNGWIHRADEC